MIVAIELLRNERDFVVYDTKPCYGDGQWHCPFPREWVERMRRAAKYCWPLTTEQMEAAYRRIDSGAYYVVPPGDFLEEPQDARGLPLSYGNGRDVPKCCAIYDYDSIPDVVVTNGHDDWPLALTARVLTA